jgi:hypothetical protein
MRLLCPCPCPAIARAGDLHRGGGRLSGDSAAATDSRGLLWLIIARCLPVSATMRCSSISSLFICLICACRRQGVSISADPSPDSAAPPPPSHSRRPSALSDSLAVAARPPHFGHPVIRPASFAVPQAAIGDNERIGQLIISVSRSLVAQALVITCSSALGGSRRCPSAAAAPPLGRCVSAAKEGAQESAACLRLCPRC